MLAVAMILDAAFGEPKWLWARWPHPAVLMGRVVGWMDRSLNRPGWPTWTRRAAGVLATGALCGLGWALGRVIGLLPGHAVLETMIAAILLAQRSLVDHVNAVARSLRMSLADGRWAVAQIVGRDTRTMDEPAVVRAAIESGAENISDGVIAPAFWFLMAGLPGILVYKFVNTADSMIGHRTPRHEAFGWAAARLDDVLNLIPARFTAFAIAALTRRLADWSDIVHDARRHRSPNAGWPEAAMARALDVALSGPRSYEGRMQDFPFVHSVGRRDARPADIEASTRILWRLWAATLVLVVILSLLHIV